MATTLLNLKNTPRKAARPVNEDGGHQVRLRLAWALAVTTICALSIFGFSYYTLSLEERPLSPLHALLRPSGSIGLRLGMLGFGLFCVLFVYPIRKRIKWLAQIGKTRHWLDFHVLVGITAPVLITFHASFKMSGIAGIAYWIMIAVALSGFVGRYIYAQIPRRLNAAQLSFGELETQAAELAEALERQKLIRADELAPLMRAPTRDEVRRMPLIAVLWNIWCMDLARPLRVSRLRRRALHGFELVTTLGGLRASRHEDLEAVIATVQRQSWLRAKMAFLERVQQVFHLWHVVHRPFSYSFIVLVAIHVGVVLMMGYY
jgi:hypothetical protein